MDEHELQAVGARLASGEKAAWSDWDAIIRPYIEARFRTRNDLDAAADKSNDIAIHIMATGRVPWRESAVAYVVAEMGRARLRAPIISDYGGEKARHQVKRLKARGAHVPRRVPLRDVHPCPDADQTVNELYEEVVASCRDDLDLEIVARGRMGDSIDEIATALKKGRSLIRKHRAAIERRFEARNELSTLPDPPPLTDARVSREWVAKA